MRYYFCIDIPWEDTQITEYDTLEELKQDNKEYIKRNKDWYIIKGEEININGDRNTSNRNDKSYKI